MTTKQIIQLPIGAGVYTEESERGAKGRWFAADKVRFRKGLAEKIGGWVQKQPAFLGTCRRIHDWTSLDGKKWAAIATDLKLYLWQAETATLFDITPIRISGQLSSPFDIVIGTSTVTVNHAGHGTKIGDFVEFNGATTAGGILVDGSYRVVTVASDGNSYTITDDETASSTLNGVGGAPNFKYDIPVGEESTTTATGYGTGGYSREGYDGPRTGSTLKLALRTWALDNWGEDLLANYRGGPIYWWDRSKGESSRAALIAGNAPQINEYMIISQRDRHVIALGAFDFFNNKIDPLLIRWSSTEDLDDWVPIATNTSGDLRLYRGSKIVTAVRSRLETVVFTDVSVHTMPFVGGLAVFGLNVVGENVSILGPNAAVAIDHRVVFMAESDFYVYDGVVRVLNCDVRNFVYEHLNTDQKDKVYAGLNREFNEVWFFYPSKEPDAWVESTFELGIPPLFVKAPVSAGGIIGYDYVFDSTGFTTVTETAQNGYEYDFTMSNAAPLITPLEAEYAVELDIHPSSNTTQHVGLCFLRQDIVGTINTPADDVSQMMVELNFVSNLIRIRKKDTSGVVAPPTNASGGGDANFTTIVGSPMQKGVKYVIKVQVDTPRIRAWVDDQLAFDFNMDATELAQHTGGTAGLHMRVSDLADEEVRFYNFSASPIGVITQLSYDISPIEVNRYVVFNYEEGSWSTGVLTRTAWHDRSPVLEKAYATGNDGFIYQHETGVDDDGAAMAVSIESFDMEIGDGEELMHVDQLIPDFLTLEGSVRVDLTGKKYPGVLSRIEKGPYTVTPGTRKLSTRMRARQVSLKVSSSALGDKWRMSHWRGRAGPHGKRG